jgi:PAS domain S-box-containing protein
VHVLSLKGSLLYVSPSAKRLLEYEPNELVGKTLSSFCHPSDIVAVLRELKESGSGMHPHVNLVFRIRRKHSGYMWIEAQGKLHREFEFLALSWASDADELVFVRQLSRARAASVSSSSVDHARCTRCHGLTCSVSEALARRNTGRSLRSKVSTFT